MAVVQTRLASAIPTSLGVHFDVQILDCFGTLIVCESIRVKKDKSVQSYWLSDHATGDRL